MLELHFVDKRTISPLDIMPGTASAIKVVAWMSETGDWAAYVGDSVWPDGLVASGGAKLPRQVAEALFPSYAIAGNYRD